MMPHELWAWMAEENRKKAMTNPCPGGLHDRVYDETKLYNSDPPQRNWICRKCGAQGKEPVFLSWDNKNEYQRIIDIFQGNTGND